MYRFAFQLPIYVASDTLKGNGNERIFWGFCITRFGISPLHYVSSRSDFGFEFSEIFVIEKRPPIRQVEESTRMPTDTIFFKPLNKSMVIVHYIASFFFAKFIF